MSSKIIAIVPAYEPTKKMLSLLQQLASNKFTILVIDDGSGPKYDYLFEEAKKYAHVLREKKNQGKGKALKIAFEYIDKHFKEAFIVTLDCDGQHRVQDAIKLVNELVNNPTYLIIGKRPRGKKTPLLNKLGNQLTHEVYKLVTGVDIYDTQSGLRAFSSSYIPFLLEIEGDRFEYEMNVLLSCAKKKIPLKEVEIETIYINHNEESHFNSWKDSFKIYKEIFKFWRKGK